MDVKIDAEDLRKVLNKGTWFPEWNSDFNNYLIQNFSDVTVDGKVHSRKQSLHSFILGVHPKAPVVHKNGDTLDNRKSNLEVYDQNRPNDHESLDPQTSVVILRDKLGLERGRAIIDKKDLDRVINSGFTWVYYKPHNEPYAVANTPEGRLYLNKFILKAPMDAEVESINRNTLDNRKSNLKIVEKESAEE